MDTSRIDFRARTLDRIATEYRESTNMLDYMGVFTDMYQELEDVFRDILEKRRIEAAEYAQQDVIGEIVGQPRVLYNADALPFFGYVGATNAQPFGTDADPTSGGIFRSRDQKSAGNVTLSNLEYSTFINARINRNHTETTVDETIATIRSILSTDAKLPSDYTVTVTESATLPEYSIFINADLTGRQKGILAESNIMPKPSGIKVSYSDNNGPF